MLQELKSSLQLTPQQLILIYYQILGLDYQIINSYAKRMSTNRIVLLLLSLTYQLLKLIQKHRQIRRDSHLLQRIVELIPLSPSQLIAKLNNTHLKQQVYHFCEGKLFAAESCSATLNEKVKVIKSWLVENTPSPSARVLKQNQPSFLQIRDATSAISIFQAHDSTITPTRMLRKIVNSRISQIRNFFKEPFWSHKQGHKVTQMLYDSEKVFQLYLPDASPGVVLGRFKQEGSGVCCYKPLLIAPTKDSIINQISKNKLNNTILSVLLSVGIVLSCAMLFREGWMIYRKAQQLKQAQETAERISVKSRMCLFCKGNISCIQMKPCGHLCACNQCWQGHIGCPVCGRNVAGIVQMFVC